MNITLKLNYGAIEAEFSSDDIDEIQSELLKFVAFLNENEGQFALDFTTQQLPNAAGEGSDLSSEFDGDEHPLASTARQLGVSVDDLDEVIYVDPELDEDPQLLVDIIELGDSTVEQQRSAAYALLYAWDECYGNSRMKTSKLKEIFEIGGVSTSNLSRAWKNEGEGKFDSQGLGRSATVGLTGVGKRNAKTLLKELAG